MATQLSDDWKVVKNHHLQRAYGFDNFRQALEFTKAIGEIAESEDHHPDITLSWGKVEVTIWTHKIGGLSENDFILAAKFDDAYGA
jgi:4a-hydroxytetrahydrobiopterin dehydratase